MKLELKHLAPYLPYDLKVFHEGHIAIIASMYLPADNYEKDLWIVSMEDLRDRELSCSVNYKEIKPILRPLLDLTKEVEVNGEKFIPYNIFIHWYGFEVLEGWRRNNYKNLNVNELSFAIINKLLEWHFDVFGLLEKNIAVDINKLNKDSNIKFDIQKINNEFSKKL